MYAPICELSRTDTKRIPRITEFGIVYNEFEVKSEKKNLINQTEGEARSDRLSNLNWELS
jgi:hypothetical protein